MDDATSTSTFTFTSASDSDCEAAAMDWRILLEQANSIRDENAAYTIASLAAEIAEEGIELNINIDQLADVSTEFLLKVLHLRLMEEREERRAVASSPDGVASDQYLMDGAAAAAAAADKEQAAQQYKQNKEKVAYETENKNKKTKRIMSSCSWLGEGLVLLIIMVAFGFGFITTLIPLLSLIRQSDGSGHAEAILPQSVSKSRPQMHHRSNAAAVPHPIFSPTDVGNRRMKSDEAMAPLCLDTPNWKNYLNVGCDSWAAPCGDDFGGEMGLPADHCCKCGGGIKTVS